MTLSVYSLAALRYFYFPLIGPDQIPASDTEYSGQGLDIVALNFFDTSRIVSAAQSMKNDQSAPVETSLASTQIKVHELFQL